jgi:polyisoprenoid-binding protein YceI
MKTKTALKNLVVVGAAAFALNVQTAPKAHLAIGKAPVEIKEVKGKKLKVNTAESKLAWVGTKPSGSHTGTINIKNGNIKLAKGKSIVGGNFTIDMNSMECTDLQGKSKEGLIGHLKSADFFDVTKNPTAKFEIASAEALPDDANGATHKITGNLTMRGVSNSISFPAKVSVSKNTVTAEANFNIDRTQWGMTYGADGKVAKEINLNLNLKAEK